MQHPENLSDEEKMSQLMDGEWHELNPSDCVAKLCGDEVLRSKWARYHLIRDAMKNEPAGMDQGLASRICSAIDDEPAYSNITPFSSLAASTPAVVNPQYSAVDQSDAMVADRAGGMAANLTAESASEHQHEDSRLQKKTGSRHSSLFNTGVAGFALAASVALVTVVGLNLYDSVATDPVTTVAENSASGEAGSDTGTLTLQVNTINNAGVNESNAFSQQVDGAPLPEVELVSNSGAFWVSPDSAERVADDQRLNTMLSRHLENSPTAGREGLLSYSRLVSYDESVQER